MKRALTLSLLLLIVASVALAGDTGTYRLSSYKVTVTPDQTGKATIIYNQDWEVKGGHIPWVTIGMATSNYQIASYGGSVASAKEENGDGFTGVRLDLDNDYREGDKFHVELTVVQGDIISLNKETYQLSFTPGWYDRAEIDEMSLTIISPAAPDMTTPNPEPTSTSGNSYTWSRSGLYGGEKISASLSFPFTAVAEIPKENLKQTLTPGQIIIIIIVVIIVLVLLAALTSGGGYSGGGVYYGGDGSSGGGGGGRSSGGGGGFGGAGFSCVSCACACACAGGGGAGCTLKTRHTCPLCKKEADDEGDACTRHGADA